MTLGHNDPLDGNILMNVNNNRELMLIDYEFTNWSPMGFDIGKYFNEVMMDHRNPNGSGIVCYVDNIPSYQEIAHVCRVYLSRFYQRHMSVDARLLYPSQDLYVEGCLDAFIMRVYKCAMLINLRSANWVMSMLNSDNCTRPGLFHFDFIAGRMRMYARIQQEVLQLQSKMIL